MDYNEVNIMIPRSFLFIIRIFFIVQLTGQAAFSSLENEEIITAVDNARFSCMTIFHPLLVKLGDTSATTNLEKLRSRFSGFLDDIEENYPKVSKDEQLNKDLNNAIESLKDLKLDNDKDIIYYQAIREYYINALVEVQQIIVPIIDDNILKFTKIIEQLDQDPQEKFLEKTYGASNSTLKSEGKCDKCSKGWLTSYKVLGERFQQCLMCGNEESLESLERKYSIALSLLDATYLAKSSQIKADIYKAADLMLMAASQGVPMAIKYVNSLNERAGQITIERDPNNEAMLQPFNLNHIISSLSKVEIESWLMGKFAGRKAYPSQLQDSLKLFFLAVLPTLNNELLVAELEKKTLKEIEAISFVKEEKLKKTYVTQIHGYASETLGLRKIISETPGYGGLSQSELKGSHNYAYYNSCHKYAYFLDTSVRTLNCINKNELLGKDGLVIAKSEAMAAGPVYDSLRNWKPNGQEPRRLPRATALLVDSFYEESTEFFSGNPLWLVELTHMDRPWQTIEKIIRNEYNGCWPYTELYDRENPEFDKRKILKKKYYEEIKSYTSSEESRNSIAYRLFLINVADRINQSIKVHEDGDHVEIDFRYLSEQRLNESSTKILQAQTLTLLYGASGQEKWLKNLISTERYKKINYSLNVNGKYKAFENFLQSFTEKNSIELLYIGEDISFASNQASVSEEGQAQLLEKSERARRKGLDPLEIEKPLSGDTYVLDMKRHTEKSIGTEIEALLESPKIEIRNLTRKNQAWVIPALKNNNNLDAKFFSYSIKHDSKGKSPTSLRMMEDFVEDLKRREQKLAFNDEGNVMLDYDGKREREEADKEAWEVNKKKKKNSFSDQSKKRKLNEQKNTQVKVKRKEDKEEEFTKTTTILLEKEMEDELALNAEENPQKAITLMNKVLEYKNFEDAIAYFKMFYDQTPGLKKQQKKKSQVFESFRAELDATYDELDAEESLQYLKVYTYYNGTAGRKAQFIKDDLPIITNLIKQAGEEGKAFAEEYINLTPRKSRQVVIVGM
ncbi:hypothetical protein IM40_09660 (plasmid) [Candidatus Paracaedimonas acanthamoebae]|nr:hypothetical protein IM40_09660 [Candidatus Paracaedimonas acanthamoebae]